MIGVAISLAVLSAGLGALAAYLAHRLVGGLALERASFAAEVMATREMNAAQVERDLHKAQAMRAEAESIEMRRQIDAAQRAANVAREELVRRVKNEIVSADHADALRIVDELLAAPLLPASSAATAPGADHSDTAPTAVPATPVAAAGEPGGRP